MEHFQFGYKTLIHLFKMNKKAFFLPALSLKNLELFDDVADVLVLHIVCLARQRLYQIIYQFYFC